MDIKEGFRGLLGFLPLITLYLFIMLAGFLVTQDKVEAEETQTILEDQTQDYPFYMTIDLCQYYDCPEPKDNRDTDVISKIKRAAREYSVDEQTALRIARCESGYNPNAANPNSTAKGLYQFTDPTWRWIGAKGHQFDAEENIRQFMIWYKKYPTWWECK